MAHSPRNNTVSLNDKKLLRLPAGGEEVTIAYSLLADSKIISTSYNVTGFIHRLLAQENWRFRRFHLGSKTSCV
jgi:phospholipid N-methyltransferase